MESTNYAQPVKKTNKWKALIMQKYPRVRGKIRTTIIRKIHAVSLLKDVFGMIKNGPNEKIF